MVTEFTTPPNVRSAFCECQRLFRQALALLFCFQRMRATPAHLRVWSITRPHCEADDHSCYSINLCGLLQKEEEQRQLALFEELIRATSTTASRSCSIDQNTLTKNNKTYDPSVSGLTPLHLVAFIKGQLIQKFNLLDGGTFNSSVTSRAYLFLELNT